MLCMWLFLAFPTMSYESAQYRIVETLPGLCERNESGTSDFQVSVWYFPY